GTARASGTGTCSATTSSRSTKKPASCGCSSSAWPTSRRPGTCTGSSHEQGPPPPRCARPPSRGRHPRTGRAGSGVSLARPRPAYAELMCRSNFSFLRGASHPQELVRRAAQLGYTALALTDECSMAGVVRAHVEAQAQGLALIVGAQFRVHDAPFTLVLLAQ